MSVEADEGAEVLRGMIDIDEGAARLGEVALVDREGRIGPLGTVFYDTLLDENAASHIALGHGYLQGVSSEDEHARINLSKIHTDFMIGGNEVSVTGTLADGRRDPAAARRQLAALTVRQRRRCSRLSTPGEVPERLNGRDWKSRNGGQPRSGVRIPPSPSPVRPASPRDVLGGRP